MSASDPSGPEQGVLVYALHREDLARFADHHLAHAGAFAAARRRGQLGGALLLVLLGVSGWLMAKSPLAVLAGAMGAVLWAALLPGYLRVRHRRQAQQAEDPSAAGHRRLQIRDEGLRVVGPAGARDLDWGQVGPVQAGVDHLFIYVGPDRALIVPRGRIVSGNLRSFEQDLRRRIRAPDGDHQVS